MAFYQRFFDRKIEQKRDFKDRRVYARDVHELRSQKSLNVAKCFFFLLNRIFSNERFFFSLSVTETSFSFYLKSLRKNVD